MMTDLPEIAPADQDLLCRASEVAKNSYNPFSGYLVGAAVRTATGEIFTGCFMENTSFGMTICAEPAAVLAANTAGHRDIHTIAVVGGYPDKPEDAGPCTPCGRCRQVLWELATVNEADIEIIGANLALQAILRTSIVELFPHPWPEASWAEPAVPNNG
jgi:cytidine deaminase